MHALKKKITAWFVGGPLHLQRAQCDTQQHSWLSRKSDGGDPTEYFRVTEASGRHLIVLFIARGVPNPTIRNELQSEVKLRALEEIFRAETAAKAGAA